LPGTARRGECSYRLLQLPHSITIFASDALAGERLDRALAAIGYARARVMDCPDDGFNIRFGAAPEAVVSEIRAAMSRELGVPEGVIDCRQEFSPSSHDVFIDAPR